eukprot:TRINITY_DN8780_c0_g1_i5.p3 TRINITY_DN8780_c0_g1~~TRINITY_DN8780_c0_g1_i5.p3  ORF type:complete len:117 (+),score=32.81 TRINITY_DN8780_c0_g1_i5:114-464(+)
MDADHSEEPEHPKTGIEAFIWGAVNIDSEKGPVTPQRLLEFPVRMPDFHGLGVVPKVIASGARHTLILGECGRIFGWGDNRRGQLWLGALLTPRPRCPWHPKRPPPTAAQAARCVL